jgi:hypothetical protein
LIHSAVLALARPAVEKDVLIDEKRNVVLDSARVLGEARHVERGVENHPGRNGVVRHSSTNASFAGVR